MFYKLKLIFLNRKYSLLFPPPAGIHILTPEGWLDCPVSLSLLCLPVCHVLDQAISLSLRLSLFSLALYLFWSVSVSKVIASCMDPDSAMVTGGIKASVKIIMAPCWWGAQCYFHSGGIPGERPLPWKCLIIAASQAVIAFASMSNFPEAPCFVTVDRASYACAQLLFSHVRMKIIRKTVEKN